MEFSEQKKRKNGIFFLKAAARTASHDQLLASEPPCVSLSPFSLHTKIPLPAVCVSVCGRL